MTPDHEAHMDSTRRSEPTDLPDAVCKHGTAMDVHCCNCHAGFIFDRDHACPDVADVVPSYSHWSVIPEMAERREPTAKDFADPRFDVLWDVLKKVDVHFDGGVRSGVTGNDIAGLLDRLDRAQSPAVGRSSSGGEQPVDPSAEGSGEAQVTHMDSLTQTDPQATAGQNQPAPAFTPGPWTVFEDRIAAPCYEHPNCEKTIGWRNAHDGVLRCSVNLRGSNGRSTEANAHLIAAAPDLYAAMKEFLAWGAMTSSDRALFMAKFDAAIAKAEGRTPLEDQDHAR